MPDLPVGAGTMANGPLFVFEGKAPRIAPDAWIAPTAAVIGDVEIGAGSGIWFHCVLRGDTSRIHIGVRTNIQDCTLVHVNEGDGGATFIGDDVTVGHSCIIHACTLENGAFVGMGATVLDGAVIEGGGVLAAGALLAPGKRIGSGELWMGAPARLQRMISDEERPFFTSTAPRYVGFAARFRAGLRAAGVPPNL
jgi:carbonic anhydrase/acetyltransferase-like protein (isoleucine patch superfamily)